MSLRGSVAVIGIGETVHRRNWPGRTSWSLMAEASIIAIQDAGIRKEDIDGVVTPGATFYPAPFAEWLGINPKHFASATANMGGSVACGLLTAAALIDAGVCDYVLGAYGSARDEGISEESRLGPSWDSEFGSPYGPTVAANNSYGWAYTRHMFEYGTHEDALWHMCVNQRYNSMNNPRAAFRAAGLITMEDVGNSRYVNYPLHLLESVMPAAGGAAYIVTSVERAKATRKPVYVIGIGFSQGAATAWVNPRLVLSPTLIAAQDAYRMAGMSYQDVQFAEFYD